MAERLAGVHVGQVHFDERDADPRQGVAQRDAGVGEAARIDDDERKSLRLRRMDPLDQRTFVVALEGFEAGPAAPSRVSARRALMSASVSWP